jgi:plasmid stabilization system protein ParE
MAAKILPAARSRILEIWDYTEKKWRESQADNYVKGLINAINDLQDNPRCWRPVRDDALPGLFFFRYRHHYIFFRELSHVKLGVISILHENMDISSRLKEDVEHSGNE